MQGHATMQMGSDRRVSAWAVREGETTRRDELSRHRPGPAPAESQTATSGSDDSFAARGPGDEHRTDAGERAARADLELVHRAGATGLHVEVLAPG